MPATKPMKPSRKPSTATSREPLDQLLAVAGKGSIPNVKALLDAGLPIDSQNRFGETALIKAVEGNHLDLVKFLIDRGANVNFQPKPADDQYFAGITALHWAAYFGRTEIARVLLAAGARRDVIDEAGQTPAATARESKHDDCLAVLEGREPAVAPEVAAPEARTATKPDRAMPSRFNSKCPSCGGKIAKGDMIAAWRDENSKVHWLHEKCWTANVPAGEKSEQTVSTATAEQVETDAAVRAIAAELLNLTNVVNDTRSEMATAMETWEKARRVEIVVKRPDNSTATINEHVHPAFADVLFHLSCGDSVMLVGPTGCGKTHLAQQLAEALSLKYSFLSCSVGLTESSILGQREPNEKGGFHYQTSAFVNAYENGGLFLFDEVDALDPNVFLSVNAALANGHLAVPKRFKQPIAERHEKFVCLCAANTWGNGADRRYVGRNQLDGASIDRFTFIAMDYDEELERQLCPDRHLLDRLHCYRRAMRAARLERNLSTRWIVKAAKWLAAGKDLEYVDSMLFAGWREDEVRKVKNG